MDGAGSTRLGAGAPVRRPSAGWTSPLTVVALAVALVLALGPASSAQATTIWAVGDGAVPGSADDDTAARIQAEGDFRRLLYLGDVYETGTAFEFATNYQSSFGRFKAKTSPTPGNHDWPNHPLGYDPYWGPQAPRNGGHFYSFDLGGWHIVSLNTQEPIGSGSAQLAWLRGDLARHPGDCTIAFFHRPRYNAGEHGSDPSLGALWSTLSGHAVAALSGHDHNYQRFRRRHGVVQFVVGTGGRERYSVDESHRRLKASDDRHFGALRLRLESGSARYTFVRKSGRRGDSGSLSCSTG